MIQLKAVVFSIYANSLVCNTLIFQSISAQCEDSTIG